jgi:hypothetical protein
VLLRAGYAETYVLLHRTGWRGWTVRHTYSYCMSDYST